MHISEEERRAQATEIKNIYFSELSRRTLEEYKDILEEQRLSQADLEARIHAYYNHTLPTLQNYYSRYRQEWEHYESLQQLATPILVNALRRMLPRFHEGGCRSNQSLQGRRGEPSVRSCRT